MTHAEEAQFIADYEVGVRGLNYLSTGGCYSCDTCNPEQTHYDYDPDTDTDTETTTRLYTGEQVRDICDGYSGLACDICRTKLIGARYPAHYRPAESPDVMGHIDICLDCLYMINYDVLPDW